MQGMMGTAVGQAWPEGRRSQDVAREEAGHVIGTRVSP